MNNNDKNYLKKYESNLRTAYFSDYSRNIPTAVLQKMEQIYYNETGDAITTNYSCGNCILKSLKKIGKWWFTKIKTE